MNVIITEGLIRHLKEQFPDKIPRKRGVTTEDMAFTQGTLRVIDYLSDLYKEQNPTEEILNVLQGRSS